VFKPLPDARFTLERPPLGSPITLQIGEKLIAPLSASTTATQMSRSKAPQQNQQKQEALGALNVP